MLPDQTSQGAGIGSLRLFEDMHQPQVRVLRQQRSLGDPGEDLVKRALRNGVNLAQRVQVGPSIAAAVLDRLASDVGYKSGCVPAGDSSAQPAAPAAHGVGISQESCR